MERKRRLQLAPVAMQTRWLPILPARPPRDRLNSPPIHFGHPPTPPVSAVNRRAALARASPLSVAARHFRIRGLTGPPWRGGDLAPLVTIPLNFWQLTTLAANDPPPSVPFGGMLPAMVLIMIAFYFMIIRPQRKQQQESQARVDNLKENDRVVTVGGIYGVVTNIQRDADRITLRVDETTGAKLRVRVSSIAEVMTQEKKGDGNKAD